MQPGTRPTLPRATPDAVPAADATATPEATPTTAQPAKAATRGKAAREQRGAEQDARVTAWVGEQLAADTSAPSKPTTPRQLASELRIPRWQARQAIRHVGVMRARAYLKDVGPDNPTGTAGGLASRFGLSTGMAKAVRSAVTMDAFHVKAEILATTKSPQEYGVAELQKEFGLSAHDARVAHNVLARQRLMEDMPGLVQKGKPVTPEFLLGQARYAGLTRSDAKAFADLANNKAAAEVVAAFGTRPNGKTITGELGIRPTADELLAQYGIRPDGKAYAGAKRALDRVLVLLDEDPEKAMAIADALREPGNTEIAQWQIKQAGLDADDAATLMGLAFKRKLADRLTSIESAQRPVRDDIGTVLGAVGRQAKAGRGAAEEIIEVIRTRGGLTAQKAKELGLSDAEAAAVRRLAQHDGFPAVEGNSRLADQLQVVSRAAHLETLVGPERAAMLDALQAEFGISRRHAARQRGTILDAYWSHHAADIRRSGATPTKKALAAELGSRRFAVKVLAKAQKDKAPTEATPVSADLRALTARVQATGIRIERRFHAALAAARQEHDAAVATARETYERASKGTPQQRKRAEAAFEAAVAQAKKDLEAAKHDAAVDRVRDEWDAESEAEAAMAAIDGRAAVKDTDADGSAAGDGSSGDQNPATPGQPASGASARPGAGAADGGSGALRPGTGPDTGSAPETDGGTPSTKPATATAHDHDGTTSGTDPPSSAWSHLDETPDYFQRPSRRKLVRDLHTAWKQTKGTRNAGERPATEEERVGRVTRFKEQAHEKLEEYRARRELASLKEDYEAVRDWLKHFEEEAIGKTDDQLKTDEAAARAEQRRRVNDLEISLDEVLPESFALTAESLRRATGKAMKVEQLVGALVLARHGQRMYGWFAKRHGRMGVVAEIRSGVGKTLVGIVASYWRSLAGPYGMHVVVPNGYLAQMSEAEYTLVGDRQKVTIGLASSEDRAAESTGVGSTEGRPFAGTQPVKDKIAAYEAEITIVEANEGKFDRLRTEVPELAGLLRDRHGLLIDEFDQLALDFGGTPHIMATATGAVGGIAETAALRVAGTLTRGVHYVNRGRGGIRLTKTGERDVAVRAPALRDEVIKALEARHNWREHVDYEVVGDEVLLIDRFTGRLLPGRRLQDGLHEALEAKSRVTVRARNTTQSKITERRFHDGYDWVAGMTGTTDGATKAFAGVYGMRTVKVPTRGTLEKLAAAIWASDSVKHAAALHEAYDVSTTGRAVVVVAETPELVRKLANDYFDAYELWGQLLDAKSGANEERIVVARAGQWGQVTFATNRLSRGVDIEISPDVNEVGGLHVIRVQRFGAGRINDQTDARAARHGANGSAREHLSLDDELLDRYLPWWGRLLRTKLREKYAGEKDRDRNIGGDRWARLLFDTAMKRSERAARRQVRIIARNPDRADTVAAYVGTRAVDARAAAYARTVDPLVRDGAGALGALAEKQAAAVTTARLALDALEYARFVGPPVRGEERAAWTEDIERLEAEARYLVAASQDLSAAQRAYWAFLNDSLRAPGTSMVLPAAHALSLFARDAAELGVTVDAADLARAGLANADDARRRGAAATEAEELEATADLLASVAGAAGTTRDGDGRGWGGAEAAAAAAGRAHSAVQRLLAIARHNAGLDENGERLDDSVERAAALAALDTLSLLLANLPANATAVAVAHQAPEDVLWAAQPETQLEKAVADRDPSRAQARLETARERLDSVIAAGGSEAEQVAAIEEVIAAAENVAAAEHPNRAAGLAGPVRRAARGITPVSIERIAEITGLTVAEIEEILAQKPGKATWKERRAAANALKGEVAAWSDAIVGAEGDLAAARLALDQAGRAVEDLPGRGIRWLFADPARRTGRNYAYVATLLGMTPAEVRAVVEDDSVPVGAPYLHSHPGASFEETVADLVVWLLEAARSRDAAAVAVEAAEVAFAALGNRAIALSPAVRKAYRGGVRVGRIVRITGLTTPQVRETAGIPAEPKAALRAAAEAWDAVVAAAEERVAAARRALTDLLAEGSGEASVAARRSAAENELAAAEQALAALPDRRTALTAAVMAAHQARLWNRTIVRITGLTAEQVRRIVGHADAVRALRDAVAVLENEHAAVRGRQAAAREEQTAAEAGVTAADVDSARKVANAEADLAAANAAIVRLAASDLARLTPAVRQARAAGVPDSEIRELTGLSLEQIRSIDPADDPATALQAAVARLETGNPLAATARRAAARRQLREAVAVREDAHEDARIRRDEARERLDEVRAATADDREHARTRLEEARAAVAAADAAAVELAASELERLTPHVRRAHTDGLTAVEIRKYTGFSREQVVLILGGAPEAPPTDPAAGDRPGPGSTGGGSGPSATAGGPASGNGGTGKAAGAPGAGKGAARPDGAAPSTAPARGTARVSHDAQPRGPPWWQRFVNRLRAAPPVVPAPRLRNAAELRAAITARKAAISGTGVNRWTDEQLPLTGSGLDLHGGEVGRLLVALDTLADLLDASHGRPCSGTRGAPWPSSTGTSRRHRRRRGTRVGATACPGTTTGRIWWSRRPRSA
ncbi:hypothetical protein BJF90_09170 [Pseudonocardia sp. CNS-004]|nr:hypothetical protein BJF90_09170 [Pseudonocardia sp. CNS-004]